MKGKKVTEEYMVSKLILDNYFKKLKRGLVCDVAIVGGGPSGLVCGYFLVKKGIRTVLFERKASLGGGIWGGGMMFNTVVVQRGLKRLYEEFNIGYEVVDGEYLVTSTPELVSALTLGACKAGVEIFNFISAEDISVKKGRVCGLVLNWTSVEMAGLHVDPITIDAEYVVDATGHDCDVVKSLMKRKGVRLKGSEDICGEGFMNVALGEKEVVENSKEVFPGLFVAGMAANTVFGGHRMGPIFGGMMLSGEKVARLIIKKLKGHD